jgi:hypothetical protein
VQQNNAIPAVLETLDRDRLERNLRMLADALLELVPEQLRTFRLPPPVAAYLKMRGMGTGGSGSLDLTSTAYATCSAIAALPDDDLRAILGLVRRELEASLAPADAAPAFVTEQELEAAEKVLGELRRGRG